VDVVGSQRLPASHLRGPTKTWCFEGRWGEEFKLYIQKLHKYIFGTYTKMIHMKKE